MRLFGGVPIPEKYTASKEGLEIPRKTVDETYAHIIADLEYAEANLPLKSAYAAGDKWRPGKGAAQAFLGEVYLTRASMEGKSEYYQKAKDYSGKVIASGEYQLEPDFKDLWYWWNTKNKNGKAYKKGNKGKHLGWEKGVGNPHRTGGKVKHKNKG